MTDQFDTPQQVEFDHDLPDERGRWGWYKLLDPDTMEAMTVRRASSFGKVLGDRTALEKWGERNAVVGMSLRPDLFSLVHGKDIRRDSSELNALVDEAKKVAGSNRSANLGTAIHGYCEQVDCGRWTLNDVPEQHRPDVAAYQKRLSEAGIKPIPQLIERITYVDGLEVAGKFDRIFELPDGSLVIGDLKTGSVEYSWMEIGIQLALYSRGVNTSGVWDKRKRLWNRNAPVREDIAIVMHLPVGKAECTLYTVDIDQGWRDAELCYEIYNARKVKGRASKFTNASELPSEAVKEVPSWCNHTRRVGTISDSARQTWHMRFSKVNSREEASKLYQEVKNDVSALELSGLVALAKSRLKNLGL